VDGTEIGSGVIVAPNSVVSSRIPKNTMIMGNPAKIIKKIKDTMNGKKN
jgi:acetyltransferase-like isoleucine patch superfamily enzyme